MGRLYFVHTALYTMQNLLTSHVHRRIILIISLRFLNDIITPRTNREDYAKLTCIRVKIRRISPCTYTGGLWSPKFRVDSEFDYQVILTTIVSSLDSTSHIHGRIILFKPTPRFMFPNLISHAHGKIMVS